MSAATVRFQWCLVPLVAAFFVCAGTAHAQERTSGGRGRWITIYSRNGHTFTIIAGLRLDTTDLRDGGDVGPRWYADGRDTSGFDARHPAGW